MQRRGIGLEVPRDEKTRLFTSDSVVELIKKVMVDEKGESMRANAWTMRDIFGNVELNDSSLKEFDQCLETNLAT